jgi:glycosyltransferase involved in cell wall biosynthesis
MDTVSAIRNRCIALVRIGSFSHVNQSLLEEMHRQFPGWEIDDIDVARLVSKADRWGLRNLSTLVASHGWQLMSPLDRIKEVVAKTEYVFRLSSDRIRRRLGAKRYAFTLQTSSLFDARLPDTPHFILTDHTALANLRYALKDRPLLPSPAWLALEGALYREAMGVFTMSAFSTESLIKDYGCLARAVLQVESGPNVPPPPLSMNDARYRARHILFVGVEWARKGGPDLVAAFKRLRAEGMPVRLTVIGCSPRLSLPGCEVIGRIPPAEVPRYYADATLLCVPSRREPAAAVFSEAAHYGLPAVSTTVGGIPERVLHGSTGYLVPPRDPDALATALRRILDDPDECRRLGEAARRYAQERFTWPRTVSLMRDRILTTVEQAA